MLNGVIMSEDRVVAKVRRNNCIVFDPNHCPLYLMRYNDPEGWLTRRAIDAHRTNSRLLRKALRLAPNDDLAAVLRVHGATITDAYWFRGENENLTYDQVKFQKDYPFSRLALRGDPDSFQKGTAASVTPELTNTGSFEKCWRYEDGAWWMYKAGTEAERFSELFVYELCRALGFPVAEYQNCAPYIRTRDFTGGRLNFEPAAYLVGDDEDYETNYHAFLRFGQKVADQYVELLLMDTICRNADRHTYNYGLLRDRQTGEVVSLAPNFDNNIALISGGMDDEPRRPDLLTELLEEFEAATGAVTDYLARHKLPALTPERIARCCEATGIPVDVEYIQQFVLAGWNMTPAVKVL